METKRLIVAILILLLSLMGCGKPLSSSTLQPYTATTGKEEIIQPEVPSKYNDVTWVSPGKVTIGNFYPGARAEYYVQVHNGGETDATYNVSYRIPNRVGEGYVAATDAQSDWVLIADDTPVIQSKETRDITVVLDMPKDEVAPGPKWEFWVAVTEMGQKGMIQTELVSRWLVNMRNS